jgi:hypothetical protein
MVYLESYFARIEKFERYLLVHIEAYITYVQNFYWINITYFEDIFLDYILAKKCLKMYNVKYVFTM